jgi:SAM-dependent methyltransferase
VGSGYFLDRCRFPVENPQITLVDLSPSALQFTSHRIRRYQPLVQQANVLEPLSLEAGPFASIAMMYLMHCLPGTLKTKAKVFAILGRHLAPDGVLFGATILGAGISRSLPARALLRGYNARGIFSNAEDSLELLEAGLSGCYEHHEVQVHGCVALFSARGYRAA